MTNFYDYLKKTKHQHDGTNAIKEQQRECVV